MVHLLITGDTGTGDKHQRRVASMMESLLRTMTMACVLLGDNIYEVGTLGITDKQFKDKFETIYEKIPLPFYLLLGNHDWGNAHFADGRHMSQVDYSKHSKKWNIPSRYYHKVLGDCDFFMLDTNFEWMDNEDIEQQYKTMLHHIRNSKQRWKILCGHHTWRSVGGHGNSSKKLHVFLKNLVVHSGTKIHLYMCGHDHCKNVIQLQLTPKHQIHCVVIGTGGKLYDDTYLFLDNIEEKVNDSKLLFHSPKLGLCDFTTSRHKIHLKFYAPTSEHEHVLEYDIEI